MADIPKLIEFIKEHGEKRPCPVWGDFKGSDLLEARIVMKENSHKNTWYSPRAGGVFKGPSSNFVWPEKTLLNNDKRRKISRAIYDANRIGEVPRLCDQEVQDDFAQRPFLRTEKRIYALLRCAESRSAYLLNLPGPDDEETQLVMAATECLNHHEDLKWLLEAANEEGWLMTLNNRGFHRLTGKGAMRLEDLSSGSSRDQAFVAMWFDASVKDAYEKAIKPAIRDAGYHPVRIDQKDTADKLDDEIVAEIRRSRFVVADFTCGTVSDTAIPRGGVYYEAGFAQGLGVPVIWTCRKDQIDDVHFDTRQYNHILWSEDDLPALRDGLAKRIGAVIGDGPHRGV